MQQPAPVSSTQRLETLDVLRGFALLGILAMNIRAMAAPMSAYMYPYALFDYEGPSRLAYLFTTVVFDLKMMGLFSMLFGAGVLLYANKRTESGRPPSALWFRRMFILLAIGLLHAYLIWALRHPPAVVDAQPYRTHAAVLRHRDAGNRRRPGRRPRAHLGFDERGRPRGRTRADDAHARTSARSR